MLIIAGRFFLCSSFDCWTGFAEMRADRTASLGGLWSYDISVAWKGSLLLSERKKKDYIAARVPPICIVSVIERCNLKHLLLDSPEIRRLDPTRWNKMWWLIYRMGISPILMSQSANLQQLLSPCSAHGLCALTFPTGPGVDGALFPQGSMTFQIIVKLSGDKTSHDSVGYFIYCSLWI